MRPVTWLLGGLAVLASLAIAVVLYRGFGSGGPVEFGPRGYTVVSDTRVQVVFDVVKDRSATAVCTVRARDRDGAEAGTAQVRVGPSPRREQTVTYDLTTRARANTGEVTGCTLAPAPANGSG